MSFWCIYNIANASVCRHADPVCVSLAEGRRAASLMLLWDVVSLTRFTRGGLQVSTTVSTTVSTPAALLLCLNEGGSVCVRVCVCVCVCFLVLCICLLFAHYFVCLREFLIMQLCMCCSLCVSSSTTVYISASVFMNV